MANKFQKSVLERLEQEAVRQKQKAKIKVPEREPEEKAGAGDEETSALQTVAAEEAQETGAQNSPPEMREPDEPQQKPEIPVIPDIGQYLRRDNQRLAKNKTFYLDNDVIESIKSTAKSQQVTDSKLVNDILRRVLGLS